MHPCAVCREGGPPALADRGAAPLTPLVQHTGALAACFAGAPAQSSSCRRSSPRTVRGTELQCGWCLRAQLLWYIGRCFGGFCPALGTTDKHGRALPGIGHHPQASVQGDGNHLCRSPWGVGSPFSIPMRRPVGAASDPPHLIAAGPFAGGFCTSPWPPQDSEGSARHRALPTSFSAREEERPVADHYGGSAPISPFICVRVTGPVVARWGCK